MNERNKRIFISDVHISDIPEIGPKKHDYTWLQQRDADAFTNFIKYLNARDDVEEVIFIGDLFDNWVVPVHIEPPTIDDIIRKRKKNKDPVVQALVDLCDNVNIRVVCLPGNHDMELTGETLVAHFPDKTDKNRSRMVFGGTAGWNAGSSVYRSSRLRAEHGSAHAMFNAPDPFNNPGSRLPLGYFISRVLATKTYNTGHDDRHWWTYVDDVLEMVGPSKMASSVFEAVLEEAHLSPDTEIVMPRRDNKATTITAKEVSQKYENLYDQWKERVGAGLAFKSVLAEIDYLDDAADRLCKKNDTNIVVFGHSHKWELDKDDWFVQDRIYANCGTWCDSPNKKWTYVEVETNRPRNTRWVRVHEWLGKKAGGILKEESVNL